MKNMFLLISISLLLSSCFKTAEDIRREQLIDQQLAQSSKIIAQLTNEVSTLKNRISLTSGQIEEIDHKTKESSAKQNTTMGQNIEQLSEQVNLLRTENSDLKKELVQVQGEIKSQQTYIKNITGSLTKMAGPSKSSSNSLLKQAHNAFEKGQRSKAKELYLEVLGENKINAAQRNGVYYNIGIIDYREKSYSEALVYFSKIYTKYPRSSYAARSLLYIARSFKKMNKKDEANASYQELITKYPQSKQIKFAKQEMTK